MLLLAAVLGVSVRYRATAREPLLHISTSTVTFHLATLMTKLGARNRSSS